MHLGMYQNVEFVSGQDWNESETKINLVGILDTTGIILTLPFIAVILSELQ